jgi:hypothetical protein
VFERGYGLSLPKPLVSELMKVLFNALLVFLVHAVRQGVLNKPGNFHYW